jgi:predicted SAM-dependent methyltransferase
MGMKHVLGGMVYRATPMSWRAFSVLRWEVEAAYQRLANALNPRFRREIAALRTKTGLSINLASGGKGKPGWVNTELRAGHADNALPIDLRRPLPFADASAKRILAEHVIEHLDFYYEVPSLFSECRRVLEAGGVLRVIVPDVALYCEAYVQRSKGAFKQLGWDLDTLPENIYTPMNILNHVFHQGGEHLFGWDWETMELWLRKAGFREVTRASFGISVDPELAIDQENHRPYSLYVDATK